MKLNGLENYFETNKNGEIVNFKQVYSLQEMKNPLMHALSHLYYFNEEQWDYLIQNSDLKQLDKFKSSALINAFSHQVKLSSTQWDYLIQNSDLKQIDHYDKSSLMYAFYNNINLNFEQWNYLLKNSDLNLINKKGFSSLDYALAIVKKEDLDILNWKYLIDNSNIFAVKNSKHLSKLKEIQSELLHNKILDNINVKNNLLKKNKI